MATVPEATILALRAAASRVAASHGLDLFELHFRRESVGWVLRVVLDRLGPEDVVGIEDCQRVSQDLSTLLDVEEELTTGLPDGYTFEVSSPGLDCPLRGEADYRRFVGRLAKLVTKAPIDGQSHFSGRLAGVDEGVVVLEEGRRTHRVPMDLVSRARLDVEF